MKNKLFLAFAAVLFAAITVFNLNLTQKEATDNITLTLVNMVAGAEEEGEIDIDINWGQYYCVCKWGGQCQTGNWVSFRRRCAGTPSQTPVVCTQYHHTCPQS